MATRRSRKSPSKVPSKSKDEGFPWIPLVLGAGLVYLGYRWMQSGIVSPLPLPGRTTPSSPSSPQQPQSLASLLCSSASARATFNFQALLYSFGYTDQVPDGLNGPITQGLMAQVNTDTGGAIASQGQLQAAHVAALAYAGANAQPRLLPMALPDDIIILLNQDARAADPNAVLIQANSTANACS